MAQTAGSGTTAKALKEKASLYEGHGFHGTPGQVSRAALTCCF
jgi:hypothetical protein